MITKVINEPLDYPIEPLPQDLLLELPGMKKGQRIVAIRKARGINQQIQLRKKAKLANATCATIETRDSIPLPGHLYNISRVLKIDPLLIVFGQPWKEVSDKLIDAQKMFFLRLRRGWTQKELALELEKAGLIFETDQTNSKRTSIAQWERGAAIPTLRKRSIIRRVLNDETLFQKITVPILKPVVQRVAPVAPAEPKAKPAPKPATKPEPNRQKQIDAKAYEALSLLGNLETIQIDKDTNLDSRPSILRIRVLTLELRQMGAEEEAKVVETDLEKKLTALRQKIVMNQQPTPQIEKRPEISPAERKIANRTISSLLQQFPGKSILQVLPLLVRHKKDWVAVQVAIDRIEEHQSHKLTPEDFIYLQRVKKELQEIKGENPQRAS